MSTEREKFEAWAATEVQALRDAAHDAIMRALDEASVYNDVLRGMCVEVGLEKFSDALAGTAPTGQVAEPPFAVLASRLHAPVDPTEHSGQAVQRPAGGDEA